MQNVENSPARAENSPARDAADKVRAARDVLEAVQRFRYDNQHPALREAMRQTALAALESARVDAVDAWNMRG